MAVTSVEASAAHSVPNERRRVFFGLFVFPMLIAVTMAVLLSSIILLTREDETPESLISAIKSGSQSKRWQKAFELSNELNRKEELIRSSGIRNEIIYILNDSAHYDGKTRAYMAMALAHFADPEAEEALRRALQNTDDSGDTSFPLFVLWAIGNQTRQNSPAPQTISIVKHFLQSEHADLRKTAAYVLGALGALESTPDLSLLLDDSVLDVRWNAALALARLGNSAGRAIMLEMVDRMRLNQLQELSETQTEQAIVNGAKGLGLIAGVVVNPEEITKTLESLSKNDPSLKVKEAAREALVPYRVKNHV